MSIESEQRQRRGIRFTALVVAFVFTATNATWNTPAVAAPADVAAPVVSSIDTLAIPAEMGTITRKQDGGWRMEDGEKSGLTPSAFRPPPSAKFVVLIQDAHAVIDAQENIAKILGHLGKAYGVRLAALEGAKGRLEPILLKTFPEPSVKRKILAGYENRAELSGPEMAAVLQEETTDFRGMEDWGLYEKNYFAYLRAQEKKGPLKTQWNAFKQTLDSERAKAYDPKLNEFQEARENFLTERASLLDLLVYLSEFKGLLEARHPEPDAFLRKQESGEGSQSEILPSDLVPPTAGHRGQNDETTATGYQELPGLIDSIGYENSGKQDALVPMVRKIADEFKTKYLRGLGVKTEMNFYNRYQAFMTGQITAGQMLQYLVQVGRENGKNVKLNPALKKLLGHAELLSEIKGSRLYDELQRFLPEVEASLIKTPAQREIAEKYQKLFLLKELIELELTHEALAKYQKEPDAYLSLMVDPAFKQGLAPALEFYQAALVRDQAFMGKIDAMMKDAKQKTVAVVAGGFHTNGLERILKEKGVSYAVVTPKIASLAGIENYAKVMKGEVSFKEYFKTTYFDALMRHATKALVEALPIPDRVRTLKLWRDNVIRELSKEGRITDAGKYLPYIDEILQSMPEMATAIGPKRTKEEILGIVRKELEKFKTDSLERIWKTFEFQLGLFTDGLKQLIAKKNLNTQSVSALLDRASQTRPTFVSPPIRLVYDTKILNLRVASETLERPGFGQGASNVQPSRVDTGLLSPQLVAETLGALAKGSKRSENRVVQDAAKALAGKLAEATIPETVADKSAGVVVLADIRETANRLGVTSATLAATILATNAQAQPTPAIRGSTAGTPAEKGVAQPNFVAGDRIAPSAKPAAPETPAATAAAMPAKDDSASAFYKALTAELVSSEAVLTPGEVLDRLARKIQALGGRPEDLTKTLRYLVDHLKRDNSGDLGQYPGLEQLDYNEIYRYFSDKAEALVAVLSKLEVDPDEAVVLLGSDAEHLMPALELVQGRNAGHFSLNRSRLMGDHEYDALKSSENQVIGSTGYTEKTQTKIPGFKKEFSWEDNSLLNSTLFQIARFAMHTDRYEGKNFEERFAAGLRDEFNNRTLQKQRTGFLRKATLFGTPTKASEDAIKEEIKNNGFSTRSMALFEEFYNQHLRAHNTVRIPDIGTTGLQPLMLYGTLEYLKKLAENEADPDFFRLTPQQQQMARDIKASGKKIKISLIGRALDKVWNGVPMGQDMQIISAQNSLFDILERFHSLESNRDLKVVPSAPTDQALSYFVSLVTRNVILETRSEQRVGETAVESQPVAAGTSAEPIRPLAGELADAKLETPAATAERASENRGSVHIYGDKKPTVSIRLNSGLEEMFRLTNEEFISREPSVDGEKKGVVLRRISLQTEDEKEDLALYGFSQPATGPGGADKTVLAIRGGFIHPVFRKKSRSGLLRPLLNIFFSMYPNATETHPVLCIPLLNYMLEHEYGFEPKKGAMANAWLQLEPGKDGKRKLFFRDTAVHDWAVEWMPPTDFTTNYDLEMLEKDAGVGGLEPLHLGEALYLKDTVKFRAAMLTVPVTKVEVPVQTGGLDAVPARQLPASETPATPISPPASELTVAESDGRSESGVQSEAAPVSVPNEQVIRVLAALSSLGHESNKVTEMSGAFNSLGLNMEDLSEEIGADPALVAQFDAIRKGMITRGTKVIIQLVREAGRARVSRTKYSDETILSWVEQMDNAYQSYRENRSRLESIKDILIRKSPNFITAFQLYDRTVNRIDPVLADKVGLMHGTLAARQIDLRDILSTEFLIAQLQDAGSDQEMRTRINAELPSEPVYVNGSWISLVSVICNMVDNAYKAALKGSKENARVTLKLTVEDGKALIRVVDNGVGIPKEKLEAMNKPFFTDGGTGVGLTESRLVLKDHGGALEIDSTVGTGSTFKLSLPLAKPNLQGAAQIRSEATGTEVSSSLKPTDEAKKRAEVRTRNELDLEIMDLSMIVHDLDAVDEYVGDPLDEKEIQLIGGLLDSVKEEAKRLNDADMSAYLARLDLGRDIQKGEMSHLGAAGRNGVTGIHVTLLKAALNAQKKMDAGEELTPKDETVLHLLKDVLLHESRHQIDFRTPGLFAGLEGYAKRQAEEASAIGMTAAYFDGFVIRSEKEFLAGYRYPYRDGSKRQVAFSVSGKEPLTQGPLAELFDGRTGDPFAMILAASYDMPADSKPSPVFPVRKAEVTKVPKTPASVIPVVSVRSESRGSFVQNMRAALAAGVIFGMSHFAPIDVNAQGLDDVKVPVAVQMEVNQNFNEKELWEAVQGQGLLRGVTLEDLKASIRYSQEKGGVVRDAIQWLIDKKILPEGARRAKVLFLSGIRAENYKKINSSRDSFAMAFLGPDVVIVDKGAFQSVAPGEQTVWLAVKIGHEIMHILLEKNVAVIIQEAKTFRVTYEALLASGKESPEQLKVQLRVANAFKVLAENPGGVVTKAFGLPASNEGLHRLNYSGVWPEPDMVRVKLYDMETEAEVMEGVNDAGEIYELMNLDAKIPSPEQVMNVFQQNSGKVNRAFGRSPDAGLKGLGIGQPQPGNEPGTALVPLTGPKGNVVMFGVDPEKGTVEPMQLKSTAPAAEQPGTSAIRPELRATTPRSELRLEALNNDIAALESEIRRFGVNKLPVMGFHGQPPRAVGSYFYFVFRGMKYAALNSDLAMPAEEFFERLQGVIISTANYSEFDFSKGRPPVIHLLNDANEFRLFGSNEKSATNTLAVFDPYKDDYTHYRYFPWEGSTKPEKVPGQAKREIAVTDEELREIQAEGQRRAKPQEGVTANLVMTYFACRLLYKKVLVEIIRAVPNASLAKQPTVEPEEEAGKVFAKPVETQDLTPSVKLGESVAETGRPEVRSESRMKTAATLAFATALMTATPEGKPRSGPEVLPAAAPQSAYSAAEIATLVDHIYRLTRENSSVLDLITAYRLKLDLLQRLGVLSPDKITLYPLIGEDLMPAEWAPVVGMDMEREENIGDAETVEGFQEELSSKLGQGLNDFKIHEAVNVPMDVLDVAGPGWESLKAKVGSQKVGVLFIKGWIGFMALKEMNSEKTGEEYERESWETLKKLDGEFIPEGGFIVLFSFTDERIERIKKELGYEDFLEKMLSREDLKKLDQTDETDEIRIGSGQGLPRKFSVGGKLVVLQKKTNKPGAPAETPEKQTGRSEARGVRSESRSQAVNSAIISSIISGYRLGTLEKDLEDLKKSFPENKNLSSFSAQGGFREALEKVSQQAVQEVIGQYDFRILTTEGGVLDVYESPERPEIIVKVAKGNIKGGVYVSEDYIQYEAKIRPGYRLAKNVLGDLFVTMILTNAVISLNGQRVVVPEAIIQEKVEVIGDILERYGKKIRNAATQEERQQLDAEMEMLENRWLVLLTSMQKRGILDRDWGNLPRNYGVTETGQIVGFDADQYTDRDYSRLPYRVDTKIPENATRLERKLSEFFVRDDFQKYGYLPAAGNSGAKRVPDTFQDEIEAAQRNYLEGVLGRGTVVDRLPGLRNREAVIGQVWDQRRDLRRSELRKSGFKQAVLVALTALSLNLSNPAVAPRALNLAQVVAKTVLVGGTVGVLAGCEETSRDNVGFSPLAPEDIPAGYTSFHNLSSAEQEVLTAAWSELQAMASDSRNRDLRTLLSDPAWQDHVFVSPNTEGRAEGGAGGLAFEQLVTVDQGALDWVMSGQAAAREIFISTILHELVHTTHFQLGLADSRSSQAEENITRVETAEFFKDSYYVWDRTKADRPLEEQVTRYDPKSPDYRTPAYGFLEDGRVVFSVDPESGMVNAYYYDENGEMVAPPSEITDYAFSLERAAQRSESRTEPAVAQPWIRLGEMVNARWWLKQGLEYAFYAAVFAPSILPLIIGWDLLEAALPRTFFDKFLSGEGAFYGIAAGLKVALLSTVLVSFGMPVLANVFFFPLIDYLKFKFAWDPTGEAHDQGVFSRFTMGINAGFLSILIRTESSFDSFKKSLQEALNLQAPPIQPGLTPDRAETGARSELREEALALSEEEMANFNAVLPGWDWRRAAKVLEREAKRNPNEKWYNAENGVAYWNNHIEVREAILRLFADVFRGDVTDKAVFEERFRELNRIALWGRSGNSYYVPPTLDQSIANLSDKNKARMFSSFAGQYFSIDAADSVSSIFTSLKNFMNAGSMGQASDERIRILSAMYKNLIGVQTEIFEHANHSIYMNLINTLLRLVGLNGISHGNWDEIVKTRKVNVAEHFENMVMTANPEFVLGRERDIEKSLEDHRSGAVEALNSLDQMLPYAIPFGAHNALVKTVIPGVLERVNGNEFSNAKEQIIGLLAIIFDRESLGPTYQWLKPRVDLIRDELDLARENRDLLVRSASTESTKRSEVMGKEVSEEAKAALAAIPVTETIARDDPRIMGRTLRIYPVGKQIMGRQGYGVILKAGSSIYRFVVLEDAKRGLRITYQRLSPDKATGKEVSVSPIFETGGSLHFGDPGGDDSFDFSFETRKDVTQRVFFEISDRSEVLSLFGKPKGVEIRWDPLPGTGVEDVPQVKQAPKAEDEERYSGDDVTPEGLTMREGFIPNERTMMDQTRSPFGIVNDVPAFVITDGKVERNPEYHNPMQEGSVRIETSPGKFETFETFEEIAKALRDVVTPEDAGLLAKEENGWILGDDAVSDFITHKAHVFNEPGYAKKNMTLREFIREYLDRVTGYLTAPESEREQLAAGLAKDYRYFARAQILQDKPKSKLALLYSTERDLPEVVTDEDPRASDPDVMVVERTGYQLDKGRTVEINGELVELPPEKVIFAKWKGRTFFIYSSRTHTVGGVSQRVWRHAEAILGSWFVKHMGEVFPENVDELPPQLGSVFDEIVGSSEISIVQSSVAFRKRAEKLGLLDFGQWDELAGIFEARSPVELARLVSEMSDELKVNPQVKQAQNYMLKSWGLETEDVTEDEAITQEAVTEAPTRNGNEPDSVYFAKEQPKNFFGKALESFGVAERSPSQDLVVERQVYEFSLGQKNLQALFARWQGRVLLFFREISKEKGMPKEGPWTRGALVEGFRPRVRIVPPTELNKPSPSEVPPGIAAELDRLLTLPEKQTAISQKEFRDHADAMGFLDFNDMGSLEEILKAETTGKIREIVGNMAEKNRPVFLPGILMGGNAQVRAAVDYRTAQLKAARSEMRAEPSYGDLVEAGAALKAAIDGRYDDPEVLRRRLAAAAGLLKDSARDYYLSRIHDIELGYSVNTGTFFLRTNKYQNKILKVKGQLQEPEVGEKVNVARTLKAVVDGKYASIEELRSALIEAIDRLNVVSAPTKDYYLAQLGREDGEGVVGFNLEYGVSKNLNFMLRTEKGQLLLKTASPGGIARAEMREGEVPAVTDPTEVMKGVQSSIRRYFPSRFQMISTQFNIMFYTKDAAANVINLTLKDINKQLEMLGAEEVSLYEGNVWIGPYGFDASAAKAAKTLVDKTIWATIREQTGLDGKIQEIKKQNERLSQIISVIKAANFEKNDAAIKGINEVMGEEGILANINASLSKLAAPVKRSEMRGVDEKGVSNRLRGRLAEIANGEQKYAQSGKGVVVDVADLLRSIISNDERKELATQVVLARPQMEEVDRQLESTVVMKAWGALNKSERNFLYVTTDGSVVGRMSFNLKPDSISYLENLGVLKSERGEGVGAFMMDSLFKEAAAKKIRALTIPAEHSATSFYIQYLAGLGFFEGEFFENKIHLSRTTDPENTDRFQIPVAPVVSKIKSLTLSKRQVNVKQAQARESKLTWKERLTAKARQNIANQMTGFAIAGKAPQDMLPSEMEDFKERAEYQLSTVLEERLQGNQLKYVGDEAEAIAEMLELTWKQGKWGYVLKSRPVAKTPGVGKTVNPARAEARGVQLMENGMAPVTDFKVWDFVRIAATGGLKQYMTGVTQGPSILRGNLDLWLKTHPEEKDNESLNAVEGVLDAAKAQGIRKVAFYYQPFDDPTQSNQKGYLYRHEGLHGAMSKRNLSEGVRSKEEGYFIRLQAIIDGIVNGSNGNPQEEANYKIVQSFYDVKQALETLEKYIPGVNNFEEVFAWVASVAERPDFFQQLKKRQELLEKAGLDNPSDLWEREFLKHYLDTSFSTAMVMLEPTKAFLEAIQKVPSVKKFFQDYYAELLKSSPSLDLQPPSLDVKQSSARAEVRVNQRNLAEMIERAQAADSKFAKEPVLGYMIDGMGVPEGVTKYLGKMDKTYAEVSKVLEANIGGFIALQVVKGNKPDFYIVSPMVAEGKYSKDLIGYEGYKNLIRAMKNGEVKMIRMSDIGFPVNEPATIDVDWGTPEKPAPDTQTKPAGKDAFVAFDGKQWYMLNVNNEGLPVNYVPVSEKGEAASDLDRAIQKLIDAIVEREQLSAGERNKLEMIFALAKQAHSDQKRKNGDRYFQHPVEMAQYALDRFGVWDTVAQRTYPLHDTREDQAAFYEAIKSILDDMFEKLERLSAAAVNEEDIKAYNQIRLGVKLLSRIDVVKIETEGQPVSWQITHKDENGNDITRPFNSEAEAEDAVEAQYYKQLLNPHQYFKKQILIGGARYADFDDAFIRRIQQGKISDRVVNIRDLINLFNGKVELTPQITGFPERMIGKTLKWFIPLFIEGEDGKKQINPRDREIFYEDFVSKLVEYAQLTDPRVVSLRDAAMKALRDPVMQEGIKVAGMREQVDQVLTPSRAEMRSVDAPLVVAGEARAAVAQRPVIAGVGGTGINFGDVISPMEVVRNPDAVRARVLEIGRRSLAGLLMQLDERARALENELQKYKTAEELTGYLNSEGFENYMRENFGEFGDTSPVVARIKGLIAEFGAVISAKGLIVAKIDLKTRQTINSRTLAIMRLMEALPAKTGESRLTVVTDFPEKQDAGVIFKMLELIALERLMILHSKDQPIGRGLGGVRVTSLVYNPTDRNRTLPKMVKKAEMSAAGQNENLVAFWNKDFKLEEVNFFSIIAEIGRLADEDLKELACAAVRFIFLKYASLDKTGRANLKANPDWILTDLNKMGFGSVIQLKGNVLVFDMQALVDLFAARESVETAA